MPVDGLLLYGCGSSGVSYCRRPPYKVTDRDKQSPVGPSNVKAIALLLYIVNGLEMVWNDKFLIHVLLGGAPILIDHWTLR